MDLQEALLPNVNRAFLILFTVGNKMLGEVLRRNGQ